MTELISSKSWPTRRAFTHIIPHIPTNRNSVDVDKFDYLARDCYNAGMKSSYDSERYTTDWIFLSTLTDSLILFNHVIDNHICFNSKEAWNMTSLFNTRYRYVIDSVIYNPSDIIACLNKSIHTEWARL